LEEYYLVLLFAEVTFAFQVCFRLIAKDVVELVWIFDLGFKIRQLYVHIADYVHVGLVLIFVCSDGEFAPLHCLIEKAGRLILLLVYHVCDGRLLWKDQFLCHFYERF